MKKKLECILLIDDNEADNFLHELAIKKADCAEQVIAIESAREALAQLEAKKIHPDLIFLDINMPGMNGWDFINAYEKLSDEFRPAVVIMMLTTSINPADRITAQQKAALSGFHTKPLTAEMCLEILQNKFPDRF